MSIVSTGRFFFIAVAFLRLGKCNLKKLEFLVFTFTTYTGTGTVELMEKKKWRVVLNPLFYYFSFIDGYASICCASANLSKNNDLNKI
jgi:hypothetical protein